MLPKVESVRRNVGKDGRRIWFLVRVRDVDADSMIDGGLGDVCGDMVSA